MPKKNHVTCPCSHIWIGTQMDGNMLIHQCMEMGYPGFQTSPHLWKSWTYVRWSGAFMPFRLKRSLRPPEGNLMNMLHIDTSQMLALWFSYNQHRISDISTCHVPIESLTSWVWNCLWTHFSLWILHMLILCPSKMHQTSSNQCPQLIINTIYLNHNVC